MTIAVTAWPGVLKRARRLISTCKHIAGAPLQPPHRLARRARPARHPAPREAARDGRVRHPELGRDQPQSLTGPLARLADTVMRLLGDAGGPAVRRRKAIARPAPDDRSASLAEP